jgi:hypothetical protein
MPKIRMITQLLEENISLLMEPENRIDVTQEKENHHSLLEGMQTSTGTKEHSMWFLKKLDTEPPHHLAIPLLGAYLKEMKSAH